MERPNFNEIKDYDEFCKYYWYREELIKSSLEDRKRLGYEKRVFTRAI